MSTRSMLGVLIIWSLLSCCCYSDYDASSGPLSDEALSNITLGCRVTRYTQLCEEYFSGSTAAVQAAQQPIVFVRVGMEFALAGISKSLQLANDLNFKASPPFTSFLEDSIELLENSLDLVQRSMSENLQRNESRSNVQHWLSAALTYNNDCNEFLHNFNSIALTSHIVDLGIPLLSNALSVAAALSWNAYDFRSWEDAPAEVSLPISTSSSTLEQGLLERDLPLPRILRMASSVVSRVPVPYNLPTYRTIQDAVDEAPSHSTSRHMIYITEGIYEEKIRVPNNKTFLVFIGAGLNRTIISGSLSTSMNISTYRTAILAIEGRGFMGRDFTVVNTAGPSSQAVAMRVDSDMSAFYRCSFWGFQDTLYTHAYRQFYKNCLIYGTVDFIFGNAASIFQDCVIQMRPASEGHTTVAISAHGRTEPAQATAFVCQSCFITGTPEYIASYFAEPSRHVAYLGRPWKAYARSVFIQSFIDVVITPTGWLPWTANQTTAELANTTLAEYRSFGPGSSPLRRASWSKQLNFFTALQFTVRQLVQGGFWLPFAGIPFRLAF